LNFVAKKGPARSRIFAKVSSPAQLCSNEPGLDSIRQPWRPVPCPIVSAKCRTPIYTPCFLYSHVRVGVYRVAKILEFLCKQCERSGGRISSGPGSFESPRLYAGRAYHFFFDAGPFLAGNLKFKIFAVQQKFGTLITPAQLHQTGRPLDML
jgi:hypothetical protein